jgi:6-phosphogluconolactonase (cycloisomerase 2 family)
MNHLDSKKQSRRNFLQGAATLASPLLAAPAWGQDAQPGSSKAPREGRAAAAVYAYVGCFTTAERHGRGDGIHVYRMDTETGAWTHIQQVGNLVNPSFLVLSRDERFLYSVHGDEKYATSFAVDKGTGRLTLLNQAATGGSNGAHQAIDPSGRFMLVANYATGAVAVMPVRPDGTLADQVQLMELRGQPGPNRAEQASSHPHQIVFDPSGRFVAAPDKGLDRVFTFRFDQASGKLSPTEQGSVMARAGSGCRHIAFHPAAPFAWVANELNSTVTTYHWDAGKGVLQPVQIVPSLPSDFTGNSTPAEIVVSAGGRFVYCSNRGHDSIAVFSVDPKAGLLTPVGWTPTQGKQPRFIALDPSQRFLYAANEQGDTIVTFRVDRATGRLTPTGQVVRNASPVTIAFTSRA